MWISVLIVVMVVHEVSHGGVAYLLGDRTAHRMGRLTLNPLKHIDPVWTIALPSILYLVGLPPIGMAKPVPVNFSALHKPKRDMFFVAFAGPLSNLLSAALCAYLLQLFPCLWLLYAVYLNLGLGIFNMIPILPLDGGRVMVSLLPNAYAYRFAKTERFGMPIIMGLVFFGVLQRMIIPLMNIFCVLLHVPTIG